jgi:hypothetical protein
MNSVTLDSVLDQAEKLPLEEQVLLSKILRKRLTEEKRKKLIESVREGLAEYNAGLSHTGSVEDLFNELDDEE